MMKNKKIKEMEIVIDEYTGETVRLLEDGTYEIFNSFKPLKFEPVENDFYYFVDLHGCVEYEKWNNNSTCQYRLKNMKLFNTSMECQRYIDYTEYKNNLSVEFSKGNENYYFIYDYYYNLLLISCITDCFIGGVTYFKSKGDAIELRDKFGERSILAYEFNYFE